MVDLNKGQTRALRKLFTKVKFDSIGFGETTKSENVVVRLGAGEANLFVEMKEDGKTEKMWKG